VLGDLQALICYAGIRLQVALLELNPIVPLIFFSRTISSRKSISLEVENETTLKKSLSKDEATNSDKRLLTT